MLAKFRALTGLWMAIALGTSAWAAPGDVSVTTAPPPAVQLADESALSAPPPADEAALPVPVDVPVGEPVTSDDDGEEIPLDRVWAVRMPGTQPLEIAYATDGQSVTNAESIWLSEMLGHLKKFGLDVRGGFAVNGVDSEAVEAAHAWLVTEQAPSRLSRQRPISLVFFSYQQGMDIHVRHIRQRGSDIEVHFFKVPRDDDQFSAQVAIIPLHSPPSGSLKIVLRGQLDPTAAPRDGVMVVTVK